MPVRSFIALLLLVNYLLVVGAGCVSRPEDQNGLLLVQTHTADQSYQECRYLRMDGLENFLTEALASRYKSTTETPKHHLVSVVSSVDAHCLPQPGYQLPTAIRRMATTVTHPLTVATVERSRDLDAPPWLV